MKASFIILFLFYCQVASATTIPVGKNQLFTSLRAAINHSKDGDSILLYSGIYKEGNIVINKSIKIIGIGDPVLDGEYKFQIFTVSGERILIKGIQFKNSGSSSTKDFAAISIINAQDVILENNSITNAYFGIHVANAQDCIIRNNIVSGSPKTEQTSANGIHLWKCDNILISDNEVKGHRDGIYFEFVTNALIEKNKSHHNIRYGLHFMFSNNDAYLNNYFSENGAGVAVMYSHHVIMGGNIFDHNWGSNAYGILLKEISDALVFKNVFKKNSVAILMESTNRIEAMMNNFNDNGWALRIQASCNENTIHHNNFNGNTFDIATNGTAMLNNFYNNYWDKYEGYDINRDGMGDVAYHPVSMYSMVIEQNPHSLILLRSFIVSLLDKAEKAIPSITPENMIDIQPVMKGIKL